MSHCPGCTKHYGPSPSCPGCGHEDLERQLAEANAKIEHYQKTVSPSEENREARRMLESKLAEAQARVETTENDNRFLAQGRDQAFRERDDLKATLEQSLETLGDLIAETGPVYDPIATAEARARAVTFLDSALDAGEGNVK